MPLGSLIHTPIGKVFKFKMRSWHHGLLPLVFYGSYLFFLIYYAYSRLIRKRRPSGNIIGLLVVTSFSFLILALMTKDPIFSTMGLPPEYEWLAGLLLSGFTAWQFYLNPLKERVIRLEKRFAEFFGIAKTNFGNINKSLDEIKVEIRARRC